MIASFRNITDVSKPPQGPRPNNVGGQEKTLSKYWKDSEGFLHKNKRPTRPLTVGKKSGTRLKAVNVERKSRIFVSRLDPQLTGDDLREFVRDLTGTVCEITKLKTRFPTYASFVITCSKEHETLLMDPDEWEEGIIIRPFYGKVMKDRDPEENN